MYIRKVKKRNGHSKKVFEYLYLVENIRTDKGPRQRLILNLGSLKLDKSQYSAFVEGVKNGISGQNSLYPVDETLEKPIQETVRELFKKQAKEINVNQEIKYEQVNINSIEGEEHRSIGGEYVCYSIWKELKIDTFLKSLGISNPHIQLITTLVIGRLIAPGSERYTREWAENRSSIYELTEKPYQSSLSSYYRVTGTLYNVKDKVECYLRKKEETLFEIEENILFYDLTNSHLEGRCIKNKKAQFGRNKQKRNDCKQLTLGLVVDKQGFAKNSKLYEGNISEESTLKEMISELGLGKSTTKKRPTIVMDAGIATANNITWLEENKYHYIVVNRGKVPFEKNLKDMTVLREDEKKGVRVEVKRYDEEKTSYLLCWSKQKQVKEEGIRSKKEPQLIEQLAYYKKGLTIPKRAKKYTKIVEIMGRLKERYSKAAKLYDIEVMSENKGSSTVKNELASDIIWTKKHISYEQEVKQEGSYVLKTDRKELSDNEIWELYVMLNRIEAAFKSMKSHLGLRPIFHQLEHRADSHMFISVLGYHILHIIEHRLSEKGDSRNWKTIRDILSTLQRFTLSYQMKDNTGTIHSVRIRKNSKFEPEHLEIYRALNISPSLLLPKKLDSTIVKNTNKSSDHKLTL